MLRAVSRRTRGARVLSSAVSMMLLLALASPGIAAFADEKPATSEPVVVAPAPTPATPVDPAPVVDPAPADTPATGSVVTGPAEPVAVVPAPAPETGAVKEVVAVRAAKAVVSEPSVELLPVTVAAAVPVAAAPDPRTTARDDFPPPIIVGEGCDLTTIATFWAGQHTDVGTVSVYNDDLNLYVTFTTVNGWTMGLTHLYVGLTEPETYAPGQFPYQTTHDPEVTTYTYTIPLADIGAVPGDTVYVAAHAEVHNDEQSETAWAGQGTWPGLLFSHVVQDCEEPEPADLTVIKFNDLNGNGEHDEGEPVLGGIEFTATMGEVVLTGTTDENGMAVFADLAEGTWTIDETLPEGWVATTEVPFDVSVVDGQDVTVHVGNAELPEPPDLTVIKFNDLNGNGEHDEGEPVLGGIEFTATMGEVVLTGTTDENGMAVFADLAEGTWTIDETLPEGWVATTEVPFDVSVVDGQDVTVHVGNREVEPPADVVKSFRLVYPGAPAGVTFYAAYTAGEQTTLVELTGEGPYEGQVTLPYGTTITVHWFALHGTEMILLGSGEAETLTADVLNEFTYGASAAGFKFNDLDADGVWDDGELGMAGWTISLYRLDPEDPTVQVLYAVTTTGDGGAYSFGGLLPGTYRVVEEDRAAWTMTVGPEGTFAIGNGSAVEGLTFGNTEEFLPFTPPDLAIGKVASVETAEPGDLITYTLTYRNVGEGVATDFRIVDDFDQRYVAVVDSGGGEVLGGTIVWDLPGPLSAADGQQTITYTVRVLDSVPEGETDVVNVVVISHPDDPNLTNNTVTETVTVDNPALPFTEEDEEEEFLPFTGGEMTLIVLAIALATIGGMALRLAGRKV